MLCLFRAFSAGEAGALGPGCAETTLPWRYSKAWNDRINKAYQALGAEQLDSAALLLQTMKLDILKLRSAGIESNIADSTLATQEARAVATDIERLVDAAGEVRKL